MNINDLTSIIDSGEIDKLKSTLEISKYAYFIGDSFGYNSGTYTNVQTPYLTINDFKEFNPKQHDVHDPDKRRDKKITGENERDLTTVEVWRLSIPEQKKIVLMAATFLGSPILNANPAAGIETDMMEVIKVVFEDNKLNYKFKQIATKTMSERECAELWYTQEAEPGYWDDTPMADKIGKQLKLKMRVLSPSLGDTLYPVYDNYGDMIAFGRYYETIETVANSLEQNNKTCHFDIYTNYAFYFMVKKQRQTNWEYGLDSEGNPTTSAGIKNEIGKIPVIYYSQPATEWHDVQEMIARLEDKISNHADTNDYFDSPIVVATGTVNGFSNKGEQGKVLEAQEGAKVEYLTWNNAPESMKLEIENLQKFIGKYTHTPDFSFDNVKGLGKVSGVALRLLFMDAHLKASDKEELFGQGVQRRINYLKGAIAIINPKFKAGLRVIIRPQFDYFLPKDVDGEVTTIVNAYKAGILSLETAVKLNPLVTDSIVELALIKAEKDAAAQAQADLMSKTPVLPLNKAV